MLKKYFRLDREYRDALTNASVMGLHMVTHTLVGAAAGYFLDRWLDTKPWLLLVFLVLGSAAGFKSVYVDLKQVLRGLKAAPDSSSEPEAESEKKAEANGDSNSDS